MNNSTPLTPAQRADIHDRARRQAQMLRRAAIADTWQSVYHFAADALRAVQHRLHRMPPQFNRPSGV